MSVHKFIGNLRADIVTPPHSVGVAKDRAGLGREDKAMTNSMIGQLGSLKTFEPGQTVFWQGDQLESYLFVKSGLIRCVRFLDDGRRQVMRFVFPGMFIAHMGQLNHIYNTEAVTPLTVRIIPCSVLDQEAHVQSHLADILTRSVMHELAEAQDQLLVLGKLLAEERVAHFLAEMNKKLPTNKFGEIDLPMCRVDIADYLGLTVETVSRVFNRLKRQRKISLSTSNRVAVKDTRLLNHQGQTLSA